MKNTVNQDLCKKCKFCIEVCPVNMIGIDKDGLVNFIPGRESICLECGQCMAVCTGDAIKISKYNYEDDFELLPKHNVDFREYMNFFANRRSVRNFKKKEVDKEVIEQALEDLDYAPFGASPNKVEITIINNRKKIEASLPVIEKFLNDIIKWVDSPIVSRIIKRKKGIETFNTLKNHLYPMSKMETYKLKYGDRISRGAPALIIFHADTGAEEHTNNAIIYATYVMLSLLGYGLGGAMNGIIPAAINKIDSLKKEFNIPENHEAIISIILGYPQYRYCKAIKRKSKTMHWLE